MITTTIRRTVLALAALTACSQAPIQAQTEAPISGSMFTTAPILQWRLPRELREISGLATTVDGRLFAHDDETAVIYELNPRTGDIVKRFSVGTPVETGDFEGIAIAPDGAFWLVTSGGALLTFREGADGASVTAQQYESGLNGICEIEGLAYLASDRSLILACKTNQNRAMRDQIALYEWTPGANADAHLWRSLPAERLTEAAGVRRFHPSSIEFDARTGNILLLSAVRPALAELSANGAVLSARALDRPHKQPEGVAVLANGDLVISDEGGNGDPLLTVYGRAHD